MAINLVKKYHDKLVQALEYASQLSGKTTDEYKLDGGEGVYLTSLVPQALNNYNKAATSNRYGTPAEMQDTQQYIAWDYDKSYAITVDKANYQDGGYLKTAGAVIEEQNNDIVADGTSVRCVRSGGQAAPSGLLYMGGNAFEGSRLLEDNGFPYLLDKNLFNGEEAGN